MKKLFLITLFIFLTSCASYLINYNENNNKINSNANSLQKIIKFPVDPEITKIYFRDNSASYSKLEKEESIFDYDFAKELINFADYEYIIERNDTIIYISTTPSPVKIQFRNYFFKHSDTLDLSTPNAYYFNTFLIGKKENNKIIFRDDNNKMEWQFSGDHKTINVNSIDLFKNKYKGSEPNYAATISPCQSIDIGFKFNKIENFKNFYYSSNLNDKMFNEKLNPLKEIILDYDREKKLNRIIVLFHNVIKNDKNSEVYPKNRIQYSKIEYK